MKILVAGGTGFTGSHACVELIEVGDEVVIIGNLYNLQADVTDKIENITGKRVTLYEADCCDEATLEKTLSEYRIDVVIHSAGCEAAGKSAQKPIMYYQNNPISLLTLCKVTGKYDCKRIAFSSSTTVYENPVSVSIFEDFPLGPIMNPYGTTELTIEQILKDLYIPDNKWSTVSLCYFNPIGAHKSGLLGESPNDIPNNLMPYIVKVANKKLPYLHVHGDDYNTPDGMGVRDYIHVVGLTKGHVNAVSKVMELIGVSARNLGTGIRYSVLDVVNTFVKVNNIKVPYQIDPRRPGDTAQCCTNTEKALRELGWRAERELEEMCVDAWHFLQVEEEAN